MESIKQAIALACVVVAALLVPSSALAANGWTVTNIDGSNALDSVSCPSASFCMAVDDASPANTFVFTGSGWRSAGAIDSGNVVEAVSCASSSFCVAVDDNGGALTFNGSSWSGPVSVDGTNLLNAVSCPSSSFCVAGDNASNVVVYTGGSWSVTRISGVGGTGNVRSVSCPTPSFCGVALDTPSGNDAFFYGSGTWSDGGVDDASSYEVTSMSCPWSASGARLCLTVDGGGNYTYYNGQTWSAPMQIDSTGHPTSVSCPYPSFCVAVDDAGGALGSTNGTGWSGPVSIDSGNQLFAVSCPSSSFCAAVDGAGNALTYGNSSPPPSQQQYKLTVTLAGTGRGRVSDAGGLLCQTPCINSQTYPAGTVVTLHATPVQGSVFAGWSGACTGTGACTVTMNSDQSVRATFNRSGSGGNGGGTGSCSGNCTGVTVFGNPRGGGGVISVPPTTVCVSQGTLTVQINSYHRVTYKRIAVYVNKKRVQRLTGRRHKAKIVLRKLRVRTKIVIKVVVNSTSWTVTGTRTYHTC